MLRTSVTKLLAIALTVVLTGVCFADGYLIHGRRPSAAATGPVGYIHDDFSVDTEGTNWTSYPDMWDIAGGNAGEVDGTTAMFLYDLEELDSADGRACIEELAFSYYDGIKFRMDSTDSSRSYVVRTNTESLIVWRYCDQVGCTDLEGPDSPGVSIANTDCLCVQWSGIDASTVINWWYLATANCPAGEAATTAEWDTNKTASGSFSYATCDGASCQSIITGSASLDGGVGYRHVGFYEGSGSLGLIGEFWAWGD